MATAADVLARHFPGLTPDEVDAELSRTPPSDAAPISAAAWSYLLEHGGEVAQQATDAYDPAAIAGAQTRTAAKDLESLLKSSLTIDEAAKLLGVSRSRISHRLAAKTVYAFTISGRRYLPRWQFQPATDNMVAPIPGLTKIVAAIPRDMHPLSVAAFMATPQPEFDGTTPLDYLRTLGNIEAVTDWLHALSHR